MTFPCIKCKIHKYMITQTRKYINEMCLKDPTCAIFFKSMGFKDIKNTHYKVLKRPNFTFTFTFTFTLHLQIDGASSRSIERHFYVE